MDKRLGAVFLCFAAAVMLAGCAGQAGSAARSSQQVVIVQDKKVASAQQQAVETTPLVFSDTTFGAAAQEGFYETAVREDGSFNIVYIEYATLSQRYLCDVPGCQHAQAGCSAWLDANYVKPYLAVFGDKLAVIYPGNPLRNPTSDYKMMPHIELANLDGSGREAFVTLEENERFGGNYATDNEAVYAMIEQWTTDAEPALAAKHLLRIGLATGQRTKLASFEAYQNAQLEGVLEDALLVKVPTAPNPGSDWAERSAALEVPTTCQLMSIPRQGGDATVHRDWVQGETEAKVLGQYLFSVGDDGNIQAQNLQNSDVHTVSEALPYATASTTSFRALDGGRLVVDVRGVDEADEPIYNRYAIDIEAGQTQQLTLTSEYDGLHSPVTIVSQTQQHYMVIRQLINPVTGNNTAPDYYEGTPQLIEIRALVAKEDFYAGNETYQDITTIARTAFEGTKSEGEA